MNKKDFPSASSYNSAWEAFLEVMERGFKYSLENQQQAWGWFLEGWLARDRKQASREVRRFRS